MNLKTELLAEHSKENAQKICEAVGNSPKLLKEFLEIFLGEDSRLTQRASWVLRFLGDDFPEQLQPHKAKLIANLRKTNHDAVRRNTLRFFEKESEEIPEESEGEMADLCFEFLGSKTEPIAVKVFAMTVLYKITLKFPELQNELKILIEDQMPYGSKGFQSRGKKVLKLLGNN
ncbi:MAG: hypothetical protein ACJAWV_003835 [Flammeovirgaceae bacterium]|jgi:hypothetical protein